MAKVFPMVSTTGTENVEKMDIIFNMLKQKGHGEYSKFMVQAAIEKWERDMNTQRKIEHEAYTPIFELSQKLSDYKIVRRFGVSIQNSYKANVITAEEINNIYNMLTLVGQDCKDSGAARAIRRINPQAQLFQ
jgi:hypothetical protein